MKDESIPLPPGNPAQSRDEIAAEIADHLAAAEAELTKRGSTTDEARETARKKFGDVEKIKQTCYWIQNGETIMLRWTLVSLAAVLCILLGLSVLGNWRTQSQLADEMGKLSSELKALAAAKQTSPPAPQPPEITGVIYAGSKDKPVAGARVAILGKDGTVVRRTACDEKGIYRSGPLEAGDYFMTSPIQNAPAPYSKLITQSQPIFLHSASGSVPFDLDAAYHAGGLKLNVSRNLPMVRKEGKYLISSRLSVWALRSRQRNQPWTAKEKSPEAWPIYCHPDFSIHPPGNESRWGVKLEGISPAFHALRLQAGEDRAFFDRSSGESATMILPPGDTDIEATLLLSIVPLDERGEIVVPRATYNRFRSMMPDVRDELPVRDTAEGNTRTVPASVFDDESNYVWMQLSGGRSWASKIKGFSEYDGMHVVPPGLPQQRATVKDGQFTRIVFEIPEGIEEEVERAIESTPEIEGFDTLIQSGFFRRPITFRVVGYEPMEK